MSTAALPRRHALLLLVVVVLAWGFTWIVNKQLLQYMTPIWAAAARTIVGAAALLVLGLALRRVAWPVKADIPVILSVGLLHMAPSPRWSAWACCMCRRAALPCWPTPRRCG